MATPTGARPHVICHMMAPLGGRLDLAAALTTLWIELGIARLLPEGSAGITGAFLKADWWTKSAC